MNKPLLSIVMITYNHESYIQEAIEGVFKQKTNFQIELIIANDTSPDDSDWVIRDCLKNVPQNIIVNYVRHENNKGMMSNFIWALKQCKGKCIAICEGDDYWTDPYKLQKQVDFLEANEDYSLCFHNVNILHENNLIPFGMYKRETYTAKDVFSKWLIPTASIVFRNKNNINYELLEQATHGDMVLILEIGRYGKFKLFNEIMGVYRKHDAGIMNTFKGTDFNLKQIRFWQHFNEVYNYEYHKQIKRRCANLYIEIANEYSKKSLIKSLHYLFIGVKTSPFSINIISCMKTIVKVIVYSPIAFYK